MYRPPLTAGNVKSKLVSCPVAAKILGDIGIRTVDRLIKAGKLRGVKVGSRAFVAADSVDQFLADGE